MGGRRSLGWGGGGWGGRAWGLGEDEGMVR